MRPLAAALVLAPALPVLLCACAKMGVRSPTSPMLPPPTRKTDVAYALHGVRVADPYRWLEDGDAAEVAAWTEAQNALTRGVLEAIPARAGLVEKIRALLEIGVVAAPAVRKNRYFHEKREGKQNQPVLYVRDGVSGKDRALIDPGAMSADGTVALDWWSPSKDGARVAWGRSESGSEESTLYVRDVVTGIDLPDRIPWTRHSSIAWLPDGESFYYTRYPKPGTVPPGDEKYHCRVLHHVIGQPHEKDEIVFGEGRDKLDVPSVDISPDGRWLVVRVHQGWQKSEVHVLDLASPHASEKKWIAVAHGADALFEPTPLDDRLYVLTNEGAPRYRLYEVDYAAPAREKWKLVLPEHADVLADVTVAGGAAKRTLIATYMHEAATRLERFAPDGTSRGAIDLPGLGSAGVAAPKEGAEAFIQFTSYVTPWTVLRFDLETGATSVWDRVGEGFVPKGVNVERIHATSKDGTRVPMFVVSREGTPRDGTAPAVLYGYGGFNISQTPAFSVRTLLTIERGGVWVTAVLRGGGELGEDWHRAGMLGNKQNVFDDFAACAEELARRKITAPSRLAAMGGSNGGLLVAAAVTQRPELFRVGLSLVPLTDMLRYHLFRIGKLWIPEYGSPDDAEAFKWLRAYSPYHHVVENAAYPAMMFATAESDSRVDPMHARKMAARMQEVQVAAGRFAERPILLRVESKAGHGAGKPVAKLVDEMADELAFMFRELAMP